MRIVSLVAKVRGFVARLGRHERRVDIEHVEPCGKHLAGKFATRGIHAEVGRRPCHKALGINFFLHGNGNHEQLHPDGIQVVFQFQQARERVVQAILPGYLVCKQVVRIAAEPEKRLRGRCSRSRPGVLFLREFRERLFECIAELRGFRICRARAFQRGERLQAHIRGRVEHAVHRHHLAHSGKRIGNSLRTKLFYSQAKGRNLEGNPHGFSHRVSAHHGKGLRLGAFGPKSAQRMLFQVGIERRVPVRRKRPCPVHGIFSIHLGGLIVVENFGSLAMRNQLQLSIECGSPCPRRRHHLGPPLHRSIAHRHSPQSAHALEGSEYLRFVPLDRLHGIQYLRKRIVSRLRIEYLGKRLPGQRLTARNNCGLVFRKRIEHRERIVRELHVGHRTRIVLGLFILTGDADGISEIGGKIKRGKSRFLDNANFPVLIDNLHLEHDNRSVHGRNRHGCSRPGHVSLQRRCRSAGSKTQRYGHGTKPKKSQIHITG